MALCFTRKFGEAIVIDGTTKVTVLPKFHHEGGKLVFDRVVLSIEAPETVTVNRLEIQERIDAGVPRT